MEIKKIEGLTIRFSLNEMIIENSFKIKNIDKMIIILDEALDRTEEFTSQRSIKSFINEWLVHNNFYKFHLFRKRTRDVNLEDEQSKLLTFTYAILSLPNRLVYEIKNLKKKRQIKKKTKEYINYIREHQNNIKKAFEELKENYLIFQIGGNELMNKLYERVLVHDESKYSKEEFEPYRKNFFPINQQEKENNKEAFDKAWEHHWKNNSHHWQYRQSKETFDINNENDVLDVLENILDWMAMGYKFNDRPYQYYEKNKNSIILNKKERKFLEDIINAIDAEYIKEEKDNQNG